MSNLVDSIAKFKGKKLLVIGDVGLDEYVVGHVRRISPEAPVPIVEVSSENNCLGLASNVAANIASLGGIPLLIGVIGADQTGEIFKSLLKKNNCSPEYLISDSSRPTTRKLRVMAGHHHVVRIDYERKKFLSPDIEEKLLNQVSDLMKECDGVILEDYAKGVLSQKVISSVIEMAHKVGKLVTLDPNRVTPIEHYYGVDFMTPNTDEAIGISGLKVDDLRAPSDSLEEVGAAILKHVGGQGVIITRGKDGMSAYLKDAKATNDKSTAQHFPTFAQSVFDVTGAGDTVIATFTLAITAGLTVEHACLLSNYAAGIVVGKAGCVTATPEELREYIEHHRAKNILPDE